ncbi:probable serine/threonine-protein kinase DDB_G0278901 isoform X2 [Cephus cinctus]|uniref:Probable serine/threonine-protein kinase DDB_G0278901 isoform X2 n=1 Tax=Cephus cinctus TaxID=211228 RepID=A0AAJ7CAJ3_CEPCN|nr:probable serine/threonine-protein kinase DDB_G0278901 isoform X2 [Cephus cinctus]
MIYQSSHQAPTMSSSRKTSPRPQHRTLTSKSSSSMPTKGKRGADRTATTAEKCRGRCRVEWSEKHVKEGLVLVQEAQLARVVKTGPISEYYEIDQKPFASGQWARVYRCRSRSTGILYAAKYSSRNRFNSDCSAELRHEIALLSLCSQSPRVVRLHDVYETPKEIILVMEYAPGGDLQTLIDGDLVPLEGDVVHFVRQLVEGLAYLHERNIAHLDIKPQNLVMMGSFPECDVKLCDFEISRVILEGTEVREILGTPDYVAPEILHYEPITLAADMWSLGVTTYVLLTGFSPFGGETDQETFQNISMGEVDFPEELFEDVSAQAKDFVAKLLVPDPSARITAKQCLRHEWLRGAPTQASPHLRRYLSKSREVLLERVVSRENLRRAALLSQATSHANLMESTRNHNRIQTESHNGNQGLYCNLSQSEMCLSYGLAGSRASLPGSEERMSPAESRTSLDSSRNSIALSQSCLLNKEQTQGLLDQAQSKSQANLNHGPSRGLLSRMRNLNHTQSQACLLNSLSIATEKHIMNPFFSRSREKLYGLKSLSKSQGVLDIYRSLECLRHRKNPRTPTEDMLPIFKQLSVEIAASTASLTELATVANDNFIFRKAKIADSRPQDDGSVSSDVSLNNAFGKEVKIDKCYGNDEILVQQRKSGNESVINETNTDKLQKGSNDISSNDENHKTHSYESEENLDSLQSIESDTLTEDSDETELERRSLLSVKQPSQRQHSDISSHSNNSANSDEKDEHSESENDEPKYTVAQLVSAFNKHQEVASKTSLEAIMSEKRINEVMFPTGPKALRLFIPDINITESSIVRRKTSYKPRKNWEELRKRSEKNEGILKDFDNDSGNEDDDENVDGIERTGTESKKISSEDIDSEVILKESNINVTVEDKAKQLIETKEDKDDSQKGQNEELSKSPSTFSRQTKNLISDPKERVANYIFPELTLTTKEEKVDSSKEQQKNGSKIKKERTKPLSKTNSGVNLRDILQKVDNSQTSPKENMENLRKRTSITKIIINDSLSLDNDSNNNGASSSISRAKSELPSIEVKVAVQLHPVSSQT